MPGNNKSGHRGVTKVRAGAYIVEGLGDPYYLLGTGFLKPAGTKISFTDNRIYFRHINDFLVAIEVDRRKIPVVWKVMAAYYVIL